ncbi:MAG: hypothetical protein H7288_09165 [Kineosporiaceae bacterium]|nr:hypothetical protein [Aeromicrobium sp.]
MIIHQAKARTKRLIKSQLLYGRFPRRVYRFGRKRSGDELVVVMCLWNRPERLAKILDLLDSQNLSGGVRLYLWNNNRAEHTEYLATLARYQPTGALLSVEIVKSPYNLGAIARFYWVRRLVLGGYAGPIVVLDDDQDITPEFLSIASANYRPDTLTAWWAFSVGQGYWDRQPALVGGRVDYAGTGGMICNSEIFRDRSFFTGVPERFWMLDDMWLNHFAKIHGYKLAKLPVEIEFVMHETNQFHTQIYLKEEFYEYLSS